MDAGSKSREEQLHALLVKFGRHRESCHCFICRNLSSEERQFLKDESILKS